MLTKLKNQIATAQPIQRPSEAVSAQLARDALSAKIMIVDDEPTNVKLVKRFLEMEGFSRFITTEDAIAALSLFREESPDVILLDLMMPKVSGLDILAEIRDDPATALIPVVIL